MHLGGFQSGNYKQCCHEYSSMCVLVNKSMHFSYVYPLRKELLGHKCVFAEVRRCKWTIFQSGCANLYSHQQWMRVPWFMLSVSSISFILVGSIVLYCVFNISQHFLDSPPMLGSFPVSPASPWERGHTLNFPVSSLTRTSPDTHVRPAQTWDTAAWNPRWQLWQKHPIWRGQYEALGIIGGSHGACG